MRNKSQRYKLILCCCFTNNQRYRRRTEPHGDLIAVYKYAKVCGRIPTISWLRSYYCNSECTQGPKTHKGAKNTAKVSVSLAKKNGSMLCILNVVRSAWDLKNVSTNLEDLLLEAHSNRALNEELTVINSQRPGSGSATHRDRV